MRQRLHKWLAAAGIASRRQCEELILDGRVTVNGRVADRLPVMVDPDTDEVRVDGQRVRPERKVYFLLHKPKGVVCTNWDPAGRRRAVDLLVGVRQRVFPVGRLDADSTGLLLLTNDGELALRLAHPRYGVERTYQAEVRHAIGARDLAKLRTGVWLSGGRAQASRVSVAYRSRERTVLEIVLREGRNREVRRMLAALGHPVGRLKRTQIARLTLRGLGPGRFRPLNAQELRHLQKLAAHTPAEVTKPRTTRPARTPRGRPSSARPARRR